MANVRKRISELTALNSASLDTVIVGVDNGTTYKIELDVLADAVSNRVNTLDRDRLQSLESVTSSFETKGRSVVSGSSQLTSSFDTRYVVSGSITQTTWDNIANKPAGIVSQSTDLSSLNTFTASISTASLVTSISNLNTFTASQSTSSLVDRLNTIESVSGSWITESETGSFLTSLSGAISSSAQVVGILSSLNSVSASLISKTGSYATTGSNTFYGDQIFIGNVLTQSVELVVGETYGGGKVFKVVSGSYALIVDINDLGAAQGQYVQVASNATSTTGSINQSLILARSGSTPNAVADVNNPARANYGLDMEDPAVMAYSSSVGGYTDWYIPSTTEITLINQGVSGRLYEGFSQGNYYWTSNYGGVTYVVSDGAGRTTNAAADATQRPVVAIRKINQSYREVYGNANIIVSGSFNATDGITGSTNFNTIVNKPTLISGSSQLTSSYDARYTLSGSVQPLPSNLLSSSAQITAFGFISSSQTINTGSFATTSSLNTLSSSIDSRLDTLEASIITGSVNYTQVLGNKRTGIASVGTSIISGSITTTGNPVQIMVTGDANPIGGAAWARLQIYRDGNAIGAIVQVENSSNLNVPYCLNVIDTPSAGTYSYSMRLVDSMSGTFDFGEAGGPILTAVELKSNTQLPSGLISGSSQLTSSYDTRYTLSGSVQPLPSGLISGSSQVLGGSGIYSSSAQLPSGLISGSSQLTASYDTRYTLSGSVVSGTTPAGTISGSSQLTSSFDGRYVQTGSFNTLTASFNSFTASAQAVTTGSNSFNGTQTITGSLIITTGSFVASQITANTSSLYLTSGSNLYVQNNGIVEITGSTTFSGSVNIISTTALQIGTGSGDEGGEILLAKSQTNNSLTGSGITIDSFQNKLRIFEQGGNARGVYIDLIKAPNGVGGELLWKASGLVNAGVDVTLGNLKARLANSGYYSLQLSTVSGTYSVYGSSVYSYNGIGGITLSSPLTITTTPTYISAGYNFLVAGSTDTWIITDTSAGISWRISLMIGPSFTNNMISIERLV
jgi:hypothetical protein